MSPHKTVSMAEIRRQGFRQPDWRHKDTLPVVSIEQFFNGNEDTYSIAANLEPHPPLSFFRATLEKIRQREDVADVLVEIYDIEEAEFSNDSWPYSERVYVITSTSEVEATLWNTALHADGPVEGWAFTPPLITIPLRYRIWQIIWD